MNPPTPTLAQARALHTAGKLAEAAAAYRVLAARDADDLAVVHGMALVAMDLDETSYAIPLLARCVAKMPENVDYRCAMGLALLKTGQPEAAAVALLPAANATPVQLTPRLLLSRALGALGRWPEATHAAAGATAAFANSPEAWSWRSHCEHQRGQLDEAETSIRRAIALVPDSAEFLNNLGVILRARGQLGDAAEAYRNALTHAPNDPVGHANLGNVLGLLGDTQSAELHLRRALVLDPNFIDGHYNLGVHLMRDDRPEEAAVHLRKVQSAEPNRTDALTNLGVALVALGETKDAEACYRRAIARAPGNAEAHYDLAWVLLLTGQWEEGWREYEWRWEMPSFSSRRRTFTAPLWDGAPISGTLLMHAEQGLGDAIQFVRYANLAAQRCRRVVIECPRPLLTLFQAAAAAGLLRGDVIAIGDAQPPYDAQAPFMSLPRIFESRPDNVPAAAPYLVAPVPRDDVRLPDCGRRRIGLVWAGSPFNKMDAQRSTPAGTFMPLLDSTDADFVSLQVGPGAEQSVLFPRDRMTYAAHAHARDFADTAAIISQLDLVIGVDTAALHLAAALGKPTWLALAFAPDYRWLLHRTDTPWYPAMRLFRQQKRGDWPGVIATIQTALTDW